MHRPGARVFLRDRRPARTRRPAARGPRPLALIFAALPICPFAHLPICPFAQPPTLRPFSHSPILPFSHSSIRPFAAHSRLPALLHADASSPTQAAGWGGREAGCRERRSGGRSRGNKAMHVRASEFASPPRERSPDREAEGRERLPASRPPRPAAGQHAPHAPSGPHKTIPLVRARHFPRRTRSTSSDTPPEAPPTARSPACSPPTCPRPLHVT